jgi:C4-dicarboxylate-specific signal transduction histidine kinase
MTQRSTLDMDHIIRDVLTLAESEVLRHGIVLHTRLTVAGRPVVGDRVQLQQVVLNLILNAIEAMKGTTDCPRALTISSALTEEGSVLVSVEDSGPGIDPAIADRLFDPFVTTKPEGLGLGLSICRSIVHAHGGHLSMPTRIPHGAALQFTIPTAP